jgi:hypothetical protein
MRFENLLGAGPNPEPASLCSLQWLLSCTKRYDTMASTRAPGKLMAGANSVSADE